MNNYAEIRYRTFGMPAVIQIHYTKMNKNSILKGNEIRKRKKDRKCMS